jgi:formylglycine-generating enzyme required for sulfatase activity
VIVAVLAAVAWLTAPGPQPVASLKAGNTKVNRKDGLTYVWIPPGVFRFGCSVSDQECDGNEKPGRDAKITKGFWLGQTEVIQRAFQQVSGKTPSEYKGSDLPVETVSWNDARDYCSAIGGRLPSEAQWEYAAKAGTAGGRYGSLEQVAWYGANSGQRAAHSVGQKEANDWGLKDMLGNVWEWTNDPYNESLPTSAQDPVGPSLGNTRALRGGSWNDGPRFVRASARTKRLPDTQDSNIGFRCVGE